MYTHSALKMLKKNTLILGFPLRKTLYLPKIALFFALFILLRGTYAAQYSRGKQTH